MATKQKGGNTGKGTPKFEFKMIAKRTFYENGKMQLQLKLVMINGLMNIGISRLDWDEEKNDYKWTPRTVYMRVPIWIKFINQALKINRPFLEKLSEPPSEASDFDDNGCDKPDFKQAHCVTFHQDVNHQYQLKVVFLKEKKYISIMRNNWSKDKQRYNWTKKNIFMEASVWSTFILSDMILFDGTVQEHANPGISTSCLIYLIG